MHKAPEKINEYPIPYHWHLGRFYDYKYRRPRELISPLLSPDAHLLDLGCGDGRMTALLAADVKAVHGVDSQMRALQFARLLVSQPNVRFVQGNILALPYAAGTFDLATAFDVIEHLPDATVGTFLMEVRRVLKAHGVVAVTTPNRRSLRRRLWGHRISPKHYREFSLEELTGLFEAHHFHVEAAMGIYLPPLLPSAEHFANVFPIRKLFLWLVRAGRGLPKLSETLLVIARNGAENR